MDALQLTEVLGALSLATDLANGNPWETALRTSVLAAGVARESGASADQVSDAFGASLLRYLGCTAYAHEEAVMGGDDLAVKQGFAAVELSNKLQMLKAIGAADVPLRKKVRAAAAGRRGVEQMANATCDVAIRLGQRLSLGEGILQALAQTYERYDGRGEPNGIRGDSLSFAARVMHLAQVVEVHHRVFGRDAAIEVVRRRKGRHLDPQLSKTFLAHSDALLSSIEGTSVWDVIATAAPLKAFDTRCELETLAQVFADFVDLKSVYTLGHSTGVAALADGGAATLRLSAEERLTVRCAALLHDLGKASVPTNIWEKPGTLTTSEWERVRLHPYMTERVLARSATLAPLATLAGAHHERVDGSGYHRGSAGPALGPAARLLAVADVYQAHREARPHREALGHAEVRRVLEREAAGGRLCRQAVDAVLTAAGHPVSRQRSRWPAGLTDREVEVLRHVARGASTREIAEVLDLSARTVQHHIIHIYEKVGVSSRAAVALFAVEHRLLEPDSGAG